MSKPMKIVRKLVDEIDHYKRVSSTTDIPYHKFEIKYDYDENVLTIEKRINYLWGHCGFEIMDKISSASFPGSHGHSTVVFKTHDINKLTKEMETECVNRLILELKNNINEKQNEISDLYYYIERDQQSIKNIQKYFRSEKINRINDEPQN